MEELLVLLQTSCEDQKRVKLSFFFLLASHLELSYLSSLRLWRLMLWQIQIFRVGRHAWSYSGALNDRQPPRWDEAALLPPRQPASATGAQTTAVIPADTSPACRAAADVWPCDSLVLEHSFAGTFLSVRDCRFLTAIIVIYVYKSEANRLREKKILLRL